MDILSSNLVHKHPTSHNRKRQLEHFSDEKQADELKHSYIDN